MRWSSLCRPWRCLSNDSLSLAPSIVKQVKCTLHFIFDIIKLKGLILMDYLCDSDLITIVTQA